MLSIHNIRENPAQLDQSLNRRKMQPRSEELLDLDKELRYMQQKIDSLRNNLNAQSANKPTPQQIEENKQIKNQINSLEQKYKQIQQQFQNLMLSLPNLVHADVPDQEEVVKVVHAHSTISTSATPTLTHDQMHGINKTAGTKIAGARFAVLEGKVAKLARALGFWLLEENVKAGYQEISVPYLMNEQIATGMGVLPKFAADLFQTTTNHFLIPTGEGPLVGMFEGQKIMHLPQLFTTLTPCFRSEAGSAGRDTLGLIRLHQFSKVEIAGFVHAEQANQELSKLVAHVEHLLTQLGLAYRIVAIGADDLGFQAHQKFDLEVWMPGMNRYLEISSCSQCLDFQSRRLNIKTENGLPHTINGSALPIERTIAAILENYQIGQDFAVPEVLKQFF